LGQDDPSMPVIVKSDYEKTKENIVLCL